MEEQMLSKALFGPRYLTIKLVLQACEKHPYLLLRFESGHQMAINSRVASLAMKRRKYPKHKKTDFIGFEPCDFHQYISRKHPFI